MVPREFLAPYLIANAFALGVLALAFWRKDAARWVAAGVFAWASTANTWTALVRPEAYLEYASLTPSALYRQFILGWFSGHVQPVVLTIAAGQLVIAGLLLARDARYRWLGAAGAWVFLAAISPLGVGSGFPFSVTFGAALLVSLAKAEVRSPAGKWAIHSTPRWLGLALATFMAMLAVDAFVDGQTMLDTIRGLGLHLVPALAVLGIVAVAWRWPSIGGVLFFASAIAYGFLADGRVSWMLVISVPFVVEGVLFLWSARLDRSAIPH